MTLQLFQGDPQAKADRTASIIALQRKIILEKSKRDRLPVSRARDGAQAEIDALERRLALLKVAAKK